MPHSSEDLRVYPRASAPPMPPATDTSDAEMRDISPLTASADSEIPSKTPSEIKKRESSGEAGLDVLNGGMRDMVDLVNRLRASGIEDLGLPLPRIAVVGNQSAGKSSLIEAISGIKVPRYSGTCTRCPLEINLQESDAPAAEWTCKISLRFKKSYVANNHGSPWVDRATEQVHFMDLTDKNQVEPALVRAQTAILNPSKKWSQYVGFGEMYSVSGKSREPETEVKFSPNVVCMEMVGPDLPNLAFIDLPGVIQSTESERESYLIELVKQLVEEYVSEKDCLILLAMTMKDDAVNQSASKLARDLGEERTIGALTKPDTVEPGEHEQWVSILRGQSHTLKHGYFVTKQPNQDSLNKGIDHGTARQQEEKFFKTTEPWATELADLKPRFGTPALARYLSFELGELIRRRLPTIIETIENQVNDVRRELSTLPVPPRENHMITVDRILSTFHDDVTQHLKGVPGKNAFQMELNRCCEELSNSIKLLRPVIRFHITFSEEQEEQNLLKTPRKQATSAHFPAPSTPGGITRKRQGSPTAGPSHGGTPSKRTKTTVEIKPHKYTLPQIRHFIEKTSTPHIPNQVDPEAMRSMSRESIKLWEGAWDAFYQKSIKHVGDQLLVLFKHHFEIYEKSPIFSEAHQSIRVFLKETIGMFRAHLHTLYELELAEPATLNKADFLEGSARAERVLHDRRERNILHQKENLDHSSPDVGPSTPTPRGRRQVIVTTIDDDDGAVPGADNFDREIHLMADTQSYHEIARKRFVDNVYHCLHGKFLRDIERGLLGVLREKLEVGVGGSVEEKEERCRALLQEDPGKERRRLELEGRGRQLERAKVELGRYCGAFGTRK